MTAAAIAGAYSHQIISWGAGVTSQNCPLMMVCWRRTECAGGELASPLLMCFCEWRRGVQTNKRGLISFPVKLTVDDGRDRIV